MINKQVKIPSTNIGKGIFRNMKVNKIQFGITTIDKIKLNNISATADVNTIKVKDVRVSIELLFKIKVCVDIDIDLGLGSIRRCKTKSFGPLEFPEVSVGDMEVNMSQVKMLINEVLVDPMNVNINPVRSVKADQVMAKTMRLDNLDVPRDPFSLGGMDIDSMALKGMDVPAVYANFLKVDEISELNITIPEVTLPLLNLSANIGKIISTPNLPLETDVVMSEKSIGKEWGWLKIRLSVVPTMHIKIGELEINGADIPSTEVKSTEINGIKVPINIFAITMGDLNIEKINVPEVNLV